MSVFPGDMSIGWGFGLERQEDESQPTDPLLAVSELEERVRKSEEYAGKLNEVCIRHRLEIESLKVHKVDMDHRITDLEERLRSVTAVVDVLIEQAHHVAHDEGRIDGHRAILVSLVGKVATLENRLEEKD